MNFNSARYKHANFFLARMPLLPYRRALTAQPASARMNAASHEDLRVLLETTPVRQAIQLASPSLHARLRDAATVDALTAAARYCVRMASRATPFGLFAGVGFGTIEEATKFETDAMSEFHVVVRPDGQLLDPMLLAVTENSAPSEILLTANPTIFKSEGSLRFTTLDRKTGNGELRQLDATSAVELALGVVRTTEQSIGSLSTIVAERLEATLDEATEFVTQLFEVDLLQRAITPIVAALDPAESILQTQYSLLSSDARTALSSPLLRTSAPFRFGDLQDEHIHGPGLGSLNTSQLAGRPAVQIDLRVAARCSINERVCSELLRGVELLDRCRLPPTLSTRQFARRFSNRFGDVEIPLLRALDPDRGVPFLLESSTRAPIAPLNYLVGAPARAATDQWSEDRDKVFEKAIRTNGQCLELSPSFLDQLPPTKRADGPIALSVMAQLIGSASDFAANQGKLYLRSASGPSAGNLISRFSHLDSRIRSAIEQLMRVEAAACSPDILAEVLHEPQLRVGNVIRRPPLRDFEIVIFGRGNPEAKQIALEDLVVSVRQGQICLHSEKLGRRVRPRLTAAHNFTTRFSLDLYSFLCAVQEDDNVATSYMWTWGTLASRAKLPRVTSGPLILAPATWNLSAEAFVEAQRRSDLPLPESLRKREELPRWVRVSENGDNDLLVDLDDREGQKYISHLARKKGTVRLREELGDENTCAATGPDGERLVEVVVPFTIKRPPIRRSTNPDLTSTEDGDGWIYSKIYLSEADTNRFLGSALFAELVANSSKWFFVRYWDPHCHIRLRVCRRGLSDSDTASLITRLLSLHRRTELIAKVVLDRYQPEVFRYGGPTRMSLAENWFFDDSHDALGTLRESKTLERKLIQAGVRISSYFSLAELPITVGQFVESRCRDFRAEYQPKVNFLQSIGDLFRSHSEEYRNSSRSPSRDAASSFASLFATMADARPPLQKEALLTTCMHMMCNRIFESKPRECEFIAYELLRRHLLRKVHEA